MGLACEARYFAKFQFYPMLTGSQMVGFQFAFGGVPPAAHRSGVSSVSGAAKSGSSRLWRGFNLQQRTYLLVC